MSQQRNITPELEKRHKESQRKQAPKPEQEPRKSVSFRLSLEVLMALEKVWHEFNLAGIRIKQADLREQVIMLGLERIDELRDRHLGHIPSTIKKQESAEGRSGPMEIPDG